MDLSTPQGDAGLYHPAHEHDACGVAFVAKADGDPAYAVVQKALVALQNLEHRGAEGADASTGDGAGILLGMPDDWARAVAPGELPGPGSYGVAVCFLPQAPGVRDDVERRLEEIVHREGQRVVGWGGVPVEAAHVRGPGAAAAP